MVTLNCSTGEFPNGIDKNGQVEGCIYVASQQPQQVILPDMPQVLAMFVVMFLLGCWVGVLLGRLFND